MKSHLIMTGIAVAIGLMVAPRTSTAEPAPQPPAVTEPHSGGSGLITTDHAARLIEIASEAPVIARRLEREIWAARLAMVDSIPQMIRDLEDSEIDVRRRASYELTAMLPYSRQALLDALLNPHEEVRARAARALSSRAGDYAGDLKRVLLLRESLAAEGAARAICYATENWLKTGPDLSSPLRDQDLLKVLREAMHVDNPAISLWGARAARNLGVLMLPVTLSDGGAAPERIRRLEAYTGVAMSEVATRSPLLEEPPRTTVEGVVERGWAHVAGLRLQSEAIPVLRGWLSKPKVRKAAATALYRIGDAKGSSERELQAMAAAAGTPPESYPGHGEDVLIFALRNEAYDAESAPTTMTELSVAERLFRRTPLIGVAEEVVVAHAVGEPDEIEQTPRCLVYRCRTLLGEVVFRVEIADGVVAAVHRLELP